MKVSTLLGKNINPEMINENYDNEFSIIFKNEQLKQDFDNLEKELINTFAITSLNFFQFQCFKVLNKINLHFLGNKEYVELMEESIISFTDYYDDIFNKIRNNLLISDKNDLNRFNNIIELSILMIEEAEDENDIDLLYSSLNHMEIAFVNQKLLSNNYT